jgi:hypothetical protein
VLEVVRHVNVGQDLIRPTTERLTGQRAIGAYFKNNPDKAQLGKATQRLMQSVLEGETVSYSLEGADWIGNSMLPPPGDRRGSYRPPVEARPLEMLVSELEARVVVLTAVQEGLLARLARLEARITQGVVPGPRSERSALRPGARAELDESESEDEPSSGEGGDSSDALAPDVGSVPERGRVGSAPDRGRAAAAHQASDEPPPSAADRELGPESSSGPGGADDEEQAVVQGGASPPRTQLALPPLHELCKCLALLIGGEVTAKEGAPPFPVNRTTKDCYAAALLDENDRTVGMILLDLKATVFLGGTLMMLPRTELEQQLGSLTPGEDSIAASAEICNSLLGAINGFEDQHVRVGGLQKFEFKSWSWVTKPFDRRDIEDSFGGRTVVVSRPTPVQIG